MADYSDKQIQQVWNKGLKVDGMDPADWRKDFCDAWINRDQYGEHSDYGWSVDHVFPQKKGGSDDLINLRPMHMDNNSSKSDDYPSYSCALTSDGNKNVPTSKTKTVNDDLQKKLKELGFE
ncbi:MAG: hypothetical protein JXQ96_20060 [Cyclobacteriaceae bacterium]